MKKYLIKREIAGASKIPSEKLDEIGQGSESVTSYFNSNTHFEL
jgi:hypothetical protein